MGALSTRYGHSCEFRGPAIMLIACSLTSHLPMRTKLGIFSSLTCVRVCCLLKRTPHIYIHVSARAQHCRSFDHLRDLIRSCARTGARK
jgi:hypothetical protein